MKLVQGERGYAMAALLVGLSVMAVLMSAALPVWSHHAKREKEEELIWRGQQYARAIGMFQRKYANTFPPNVDVLVEQRFLRKKYKDPITKDDFQPIPAGGMPAGSLAPPGGPAQQTGPTQRAPMIGGAPTVTQTQGRGGLGAGSFQPSIGIQGVMSKSKESSIKIFNGRTKYNEWAFIYLNTAQRIGQPGGPGQGGIPPGAQPGGPFGPRGGMNTRPGVGGGGPGGVGPGGRQQPAPFGQPPFGQPPNGQQPFGQPGFGPRPFGQPPTGQPPGQQPFGRPPVPPSRPPGG